MAYAIMRFEKLKAAGIGSLAGSLAHTFRSRYTPNADPELVKDNRVWLGPATPQGVADAIRERWPDKYRRDAVGCIEYFIGASPEFFEQHGGDGDQERYFQGAIDWLRAHYGAENVISVVQHNDETTPHLAAYVVPRDPETGNLNAKRWTGGRGVCSEMQTAFHRAAGEPVGLERGVKGSTAEHMSIRRWYEQHARLDKRARDLRYDTIDIEARESEIAENLEELAKREQRLDRRELDQERRGYELDDREQRVGQREAQTAAERQALDERAEALAKRERAAQALSERLEGLQRAVERREAELAEREHRLAALEQQLRERGDRLQGGEAALEKRQAEIDAASAKLQERLQAARQQQAEWEARRDAWLAEHRPVELSRVERLSLEFAEMPDERRIAAMRSLWKTDNAAARAVDRLGWVTYKDGSVTPLGRRVLTERGGIEQQDRLADDWNLRGLEPGPKGPGL